MIRYLATAALACAPLLVSSFPAAAVDTVHRGRTGCFSWSWKDGGVLTTTVYYRNSCSTAHTLRIRWSSEASGTEDIRVKGGAKGSAWSFYSLKPLGFEDLGRV
ncbi:hypothetical protein GTY65_12100 [Streptomyces sp. SID8379]|uniref:hypothetical protein n=1 Tax=unclassified Streptomyces TaxID=2593676 RepID=UPI00036BF46C|nr:MULTISPECIES: hypothetical protein [unclassified Streptomyces]MYW64801.1 hypothetical protein [Streptomyces sp. SID8379]